jgi:hypothetical protein
MRAVLIVFSQQEVEITFNIMSNVAFCRMEKQFGTAHYCWSHLLIVRCEISMKKSTREVCCLVSDD